MVTREQRSTCWHSSTLTELLRWRALEQPERLAYTFLTDGETEEARLTYGELDRQARAIGAHLQHLGAAGERVLLLYPAGLEYIAAFFGCLYAGAVAVPAYPPRFNHSMERLQAIVADAQATVALTTATFWSKLKQTPDLLPLRWLTTDRAVDGMEAVWQEPAIDSATLAFLQYTSGSTGSPKGVMLSHGNLLYNLQMLRRVFQHLNHSAIVGWLPLYHDMGLIGTILQPLYMGVPCVLMSSMAFLQRPVRWLQAISRYRATVSVAPNFAYDLCVRKITPAQRATLDLRSWEIAFNGAEPIRADTLERFALTFAPCGFRREAFYPCYGLAEATLIVSGGDKAAVPVMRTVQKAALERHQAVTAIAGNAATQTLVSCGRALLDGRIVIADPESHTQCPSDQVGEIWVAGPSVAQGYWNRPAETAQTFHAYLADTAEGPFLRTGDLGFVSKGELFVTGRLKDVIIIRGSNHYPQDIELTVEHCHPSLRPGCGAAFAVELAGEERLVVVQEVERRYQPPRRHLPERRQVDVEPGFDPERPQPLDLDAVVGNIRQAVAEQHGVQVYAVLLLRAGSLPKTSSGKLQRYACRAGFLAGSLEVVGKWQAALSFEQEGVYTSQRGFGQLVGMGVERGEGHVHGASVCQHEQYAALRARAA
ncbi:MAG TPA: fatty acyl-AMP ligase [Candidatus Tectomicrobia bacterium]|jgi:acyl-CoA synthetase (AMP-forming)/AMP-acid ligase II